MNIVSDISKFFKTLGYMLSFGAKGANDVMLTQDPNENDIGIIQNQTSQNLGEALLKGEVTQQVEELRYSDYKVYQESKNYSYIGDGVAIKKNSKKKDRKKFSFTQNNNLICEGVCHELQRVGQYGIDRYVFDITYTDITRHKIEAFITYGKFYVDNTAIKVEFYFDKNLKSKYNPNSYMILKELEKISKFDNAYQIENNDICSNVHTLTFNTYKSNGEDDFVQYLISELKFQECKEMDDAFILTYVSNKFIRTNLIDKFYSPTMEQKYLNKEHKNESVNFYEEPRIEYCDVCGNEMNSYDADITKNTYGKRICINCLKKMEEKT